MQATLEISQSDSHTVQVSLWYGSLLDLPDALIEDFYDYQHLMKNFVDFTPRIVTMQCPNCVKNVTQRDCLSDGLYCLMPVRSKVQDSEHILSKYNITDRALLVETLYARCMHLQSKQLAKDLLPFFNYLYNMKQECLEDHRWHILNNSTTVTEAHLKRCAERQITTVGGSAKNASECVQKSFLSAENPEADNSILREDKLLAEIYGISMHPAITING